jgi:pimeloyl-ACP methyl ester carboxylesterase
LAGGARPEPRLFNCPDGSAGVLLERTGEFFRLTEVVPPGYTGDAPKDGSFDSNGVRIHYREQGAGEPIVLVHPLDTSASFWSANGILQDLARDHRVIALDCRGHGQSDKPHDPAQYGPEMALDIARLLDHLGLKQAHVVGYSMGAELAAILLVRQPERFLTVTLAAGAGRFEWVSTDAQHADEEALEYENVGVSPKLFLEESPLNTPDPEIDDLKRQQIDRLADKTRDRAALAAFSRARKDRLITPAQAAAVTVPTLGIAGSLDPSLEWLQKLQKTRPPMKLVVIDGATHSGARAAASQPLFLAAVRDFIVSAGK